MNAGRPSPFVGIVGAGLSGIATGVALKDAGFDDFVIYERAPDVGGTWYRNTYPGLHCDIPSHSYSYSYAPHSWSMTYAGQAEIQAYFRTCAERFGLIDHIRFDTCLESARFEGDGYWQVELASGEQVAHRVLVSATGGLTDPRPPRIEGLDAFGGTWWHSAAWRHDVDLAGKTVAVVGSAASAVQVVPAVAATAAQVFMFSRTPNWVMPRNNRSYDPAERASLATPEGWRRLRRRQYRDSWLWFGAFQRKPAAIARLRELGLENMRSSISDPALLAALTPDYDPGCNRILVSDDFYPALAQDHVHLVPHAVTALTETGIVAADGSHTEVDVVIFCTGYRLGGRADGRPAFEVIGRDGVTMREALGRRPQAYRGVAVPGFPNYFTIVGVNGTVGYTGVFHTAELAASFVARWVQRFLAEDLVSVEARADATERYSDAIQAELAGMSWTGNCPNFYRDAGGRIVSFFPGSVARLRRELRNAADQDFDIVRAR